jgi:mono/diheme cytochrome c family protein
MLATHNPPRGSKDSWDKLSAAFAEAAASLDQAVQAKNRDAAQTAFRSLETSCMACHQAHRGGPKGGFGGPKGKGKGPPTGDVN